MDATIRNATLPVSSSEATAAAGPDVPYRALVEQNPAGLLHLDAEGGVTFVNERLRALMGTKSGDEAAWVGRRLHEVHGLTPDLAPLVERMLTRGVGFDGEEVTYRRADGFCHHLVVYGTPLRHPEHGVVGGALVVLDATAAWEREEELRLLRRYDAAEAALRQAALNSASDYAFLDAAARVLGETARAHQVYVLLPSEDADAYEEEVRWSSEPERSLMPLRFDAEWEARLQSGLLYARAGQATGPLRELLDAVGGTEAVTITFSIEAERHGALLLVRTEADEMGAPWRAAERRALTRLGGLFETLWGWMGAEARYRQVVSTVRDGLFSFAFGPDGRREYGFVTAQVGTLTGREAEAFTGADAVGWADIVHESDRAAVAEHERLLSEGRESHLTYRIVRPDGRIRWLRESATPGHDRSGRRVVAGVLSDVTEAKDAESALLQAKQDAESANRMKASFLATMSHELRTPLGAIKGFAELLQLEVAELDGAPPEVTEFATVIGESSKKVLSLVNDLFDLASLQAGRLALERAPLPLSPLVRRVAEQHRPALEARGIALDLDLADDLIVVGEAHRLEQVLDHLLSNAAKFTEDGRVTVRAHATDGGVLLAVEDTGIGVSAEYVPHLFEPFSQEDNRLNRSYEGSGLGLALVQRILDAMGGAVRADTEREEGVAFEVTLPRADD